MASGYPKKVAQYMADHPPPPFQIWACNVQAFELFEYMATQWRSGFGGRYGLIYSEAYRRLDELGVTDRKQRESLIEALRAMENEALTAFSEANKDKGK